MIKSCRSKALHPRRKTTSLRQTQVSVFGFTRMSRQEAVAQVCTYLRRSPMHISALRLIHLFHLDAEELAQAGVPYELLKALQRRAVFQ